MNIKNYCFDSKLKKKKISDSCSGILKIQDKIHLQWHVGSSSTHFASIYSWNPREYRLLSKKRQDFPKPDLVISDQHFAKTFRRIFLDFQGIFG